MHPTSSQVIPDWRSFHDIPVVRRRPRPWFSSVSSVPSVVKGPWVWARFDNHTLALFSPRIKYETVHRPVSQAERLLTWPCAVRDLLPKAKPQIALSRKSKLVHSSKRKIPSASFLRLWEWLSVIEHLVREPGRPEPIYLLLNHLSGAPTV